MGQDPSTPDEFATTRCRLMELPPELRLRVFEFALSNPFVLQTSEHSYFAPPNGVYTRVTFGKHIRSRDMSGRLKLPPLCNVSKQIQQESVPIFYSQSDFRAYVNIDGLGLDGGHSTRRLRRWLKDVGVESTRLIKKLVIRMALPRHACAWKSEKDGRCEACWRGYRPSWQPASALEIARDMHLLGSGVPDSAWQAEFGVAPNEGSFDPADADEEPLTGVVEVNWTPIPLERAAREGDITPEDREWPIWTEEDRLVDRDQPPASTTIKLEWYD